MRANEKHIFNFIDYINNNINDQITAINDYYSDTGTVAPLINYKTYGSLPSSHTYNVVFLSEITKVANVVSNDNAYAKAVITYRIRFAIVFRDATNFKEGLHTGFARVKLRYEAAIQELVIKYLRDEGGCHTIKLVNIDRETFENGETDKQYVLMEYDLIAGV